MARRQLRTHVTTFKAQVAVAALQGNKTVGELAEKFEVQPDQITSCKDQILEPSSEAFGEKADGTPAPNIEKMEAKIGRFPMISQWSSSARHCR